ncbi:Precorrin-8X methylmutase CbiC/CobH (Precorrin isomerase) [Candidatus Glomeribacter gigasporarum BEG34]|uniref:Precorrin-8X methylmutase CbiC/CobH (Precorrin isomerase) n=1 Tax=Candidatus Glomeribacter gigasporarum BEG34 TaxID=1070319 RepID=G2JAK5_9BURK|nr:Precorrin-8X methylmutase CbiC/CobH (Precorrin isomerase) [Candidatus Glomeribacter gigasporarum BEG34]
MLMPDGIVVAGHGSRDPDGVREFEALVALIRMRASKRIVRHGYLEFALPTIDVAVRDALHAGAHPIVIVPGVLFAAAHAKNDLPTELHWLQHTFPEAKFSFASALDLHPRLLQLCAQRIIEAEGAALAKDGTGISRNQACLVVVGRGTSDPDANSEVSKLARMLEEGLGFGTSFVCYAGTAKPKVADGLRAAARLGYRRLVVLPYFLFDGILVKRIYAAANELRKRHPKLEVLSAGYLGPHPDVAEVLLERAAEGANGRAAMNCALCKYRAPIVGFEQQVGAPQRAHHLKVRGLANQNNQNEMPAERVVDRPYEPHPIEAESMRMIEAGRDWSRFSVNDARILKRLVHTSGDFSIVEDIFISAGAADIGLRALLRCQRVITDVTMVQAALKQALLAQLGIEVWCSVHDPATAILARTHGLTRSAAGIRRAWELFGNDAIIAIGDAPTAVTEAVRLVEQQGWRPQLIVGLPVGFVGAAECKEALRNTIQVPRMTNRGTRGGSPWAATVINALMISALNSIAVSDQVTVKRALGEA